MSTLRPSLQVVLEAHGLGVRLEVRAGTVGACPRERLPLDLRERLTRRKEELLELLRDPGKSARAGWGEALVEVADLWDRHATDARAAGREPAWIDDEPLMAEVRSAIGRSTDSVTLATALRTIEAWREAWRRTVR